jgi:RHS repeat-associated protein
MPSPHIKSKHPPHNQHTTKRGFQGQQKVDEISGEGNHYTAEYWEMDPRLGRRWNLDPKYIAGESRYSVFSNNPVMYVDPLGDFRTKFGANVYKFFHGGTVDKDDKGQWYVNRNSVENGVVIVRPWVYESKVSSIAEYIRGGLGAFANFNLFLIGGGGNQTYKEGSFEADEMANSPGIQKGIEKLKRELEQGKTKTEFNYAFSPNPKTVLDKTLETGNPLNGFSQENKEAHIDVFKDQSWTKLYVGGYGGAKISLIDANTVKIVIENKTTANSFLLHGGELIFGKENGAKRFNDLWNKTPFLNTLNQRFEFTVPLKK